MTVTGRFAPSPTGRLHLGNLRTALAGWLSARSQGGRFIVRMEDLDRVQSRREHERHQLEDLAALGIDHDGPVLRQSERFDLYDDAIDRLTRAGLTYPCFCTRREIREAANAPHGGSVGYPGTCRVLSSARRREVEREGRPPAVRLAAGGVAVSIRDELVGEVTAAVDDVVLRRNDGVPAYNLAVVVDDHLQGVSEVVRGADLLGVTPSHAHLQRLLGLRTPAYVHVPLVVGPDGERLAKRHGDVTLPDLAASGYDPAEVVRMLAESLGISTFGDGDLVSRFRWSGVPRHPWTYPVEP